MSFWNKIGKALKGAAIAVGRKALSTATGGLSEPVIRASKALLVNHKASKIKIQPLSVRAVLSKSAVPHPAVHIASTMTTMPGGAPLKRSSKRKGKSSTPKPPKSKRRAKTKRAKSSGTKRTAPKGGLDLKRMAVAWRAAGKPGRWIDWVKTQPIRKG